MYRLTRDAKPSQGTHQKGRSTLYRHIHTFNVMQCLFFQDEVTTPLASKVRSRIRSPLTASVQLRKGTWCYNSSPCCSTSCWKEEKCFYFSGALSYWFPSQWIGSKKKKIMGISMRLSCNCWMKMLISSIPTLPCSFSANNQYYLHALGMRGAASIEKCCFSQAVPRTKQ